MKKIFLLAGFFVLTSTSPSFAELTQQDTLPGIRQQYCKLCNTNLRSAFFHWMQIQNGNVLANIISIDLRSQVLARSYDSSFQLNWWPQAIQLNNKLIKTMEQNKRLAYPSPDLANDIYKLFGIHR